MNETDMAALCSKSSARCREPERFARIEKRLPECFRSNPGGELTDDVQVELLAILTAVERQNGCAGR